ncbi:MAG: HAMP domain-containing histidine kinase [Parvibaculaceae bacterium]|nr:HAMP domain-containing histidine kinase [Parvibaculaceae bacterium]
MAQDFQGHVKQTTADSGSSDRDGTPYSTKGKSAPTEAKSRDYHFDPISLKFRDRTLEDRFAEENYTKQIGLTRFSIAGGALIFSLFGVLDIFIVPEILYEAWFIRLAICAPLLLGLAAVSYAPWFNYRHQTWLSFSMAIPSFGVIGMIALAQAPGNHLYYGGLVIIIAYSCSLWRLNYLLSTLVSFATAIAYAVTVVYINPIPVDMLINNGAFLGFAIGTNVFINYVQEQQLRASFVDKEHLKAEQKRSEALLETSEAANRAKNDFLAIMSHELRTPLNAIIGFSDIIANEMFGAIEQRKYPDYAGDIRTSGQHLLSIINDILDLSKAEAGKLQLDEQAVDPVETLNATMRMFRQRAAELKVRLSFRVLDEIPWLIADPRLFNQVVINLTSNALKFTPENGLVKVELALSKHGDLELRIIDSGIGIATEDIARIFEPFVQVENALSRTHQGTGLGLPLVKKIMGLHGGQVELKSAVGDGTTAVVTFPSSRFVQDKNDPSSLWAI